MSIIKESELPGLGKKYQIELESKERLVIIIYDEGHRELYYIPCGENEPAFTFTLTDQESRQVGSIIGGVFYQPRILDRLELAIAELRIEWLKVAPNAPVTGKSIGELGLRKNHGVSVIAIIEESGKGKKKAIAINPGPGFIFLPGQIVVCAGKLGNIEQFQEIITGKED